MYQDLGRGFLLSGRCVSALAAAVFASLLADLLFKVFDEDVPAFLLVCSFLAIVTPWLLAVSISGRQVVCNVLMLLAVSYINLHHSQGIEGAVKFRLLYAQVPDNRV